MSENEELVVEEESVEESVVPAAPLTPEESQALALIAARAADDKKATDIVVQEVRELIGVTDFFVICTAANGRQGEAVLEEVEDKLREEGGVKPLHREFARDGSWSLLDYGSLIIHVFQPEAREHYRLETLWNDAPILELEKQGLENLSYSERIARFLEGASETNAE